MSYFPLPDPYRRAWRESPLPESRAGDRSTPLDERPLHTGRMTRSGRGRASSLVGPAGGWDNRLVLSPARPSTPVVPGFTRSFLARNWWPVLRLVLLQAIALRYAAHHNWTLCALFLFFGVLSLWELLKRAAGFPVLPPKQPEEMTPREAFWLDPAAVFRRERRRARDS